MLRGLAPGHLFVSGYTVLLVLFGIVPVVYSLILSLAAGTQLFVEPQLLSQSSFGVVSNYYSANQLAYQYAFNQDNFNGAAAISIDLLVVALICATVLIARGRLFRTD